MRFSFIDLSWLTRHKTPTVGSCCCSGSNRSNGRDCSFSVFYRHPRAKQLASPNGSPNTPTTDNFVVLEIVVEVLVIIIMRAFLELLSMGNIYNYATPNK